MDAAAAPALVGRLNAAFARRSGGPFLLYSSFPTPDLSQHGLQAVGHPPCMVRLPAPMSAVPLDVRRVSSDRELDDFERTFIEGYSVPDLMPWQPRSFMGERLLDDRRWHLFVGYVDGAPVATSAAFATDNVVDVTLVAYQPDARGRGFGRAMTEAAVGADLTKPAMLLASDDGQSVYRAMGFHSKMRYSIWIGPRDTGTA